MEIRLLGPGAPDRLSALPTILAVEHPVRLSREQLILRLWPGADSESARNRLRVGLSRLRSEGLLDETPAGVRLDPARVRVDLVEALAALTLAASEPDVNTERRMLVELLPTLELSVLPDLEADWVLDRRSEWSLAAADAVSRLLDLCAETRDSEAAVRAAEAGLAHFPQDPAFWRARLVALGRLGRSAEAARLFQDARRRMRREGADFDPDLLDLAPSMAAGGDWDPQPEFTRGEAGLLLRTLQRMLEAEPDEAAALLAGRAFRREMLAHPADGLKLPREVLGHDLPPSDARSRLEVRVVTCLNLLDRADDVIQEAERILEYETNPHRRRILLLNLSWELMQLGRAPEAFSAIEGAIQLAEETGFEYDAWQCRAQRAAFLHLQGRSEEAIPILQEAVDHLREADQGRVDRDALTIETNLALALVEVGRREEATDRLSRLRAAALPHGLNEVLALCEPALGLCLAHDRRPAEAAQVLIAGLRSAYRTSHGSAVEAVGCSAEALALWGSPEAAGLAEAWHDLAAGRRRILHAPSRNRAEALGLAGRTPHPPADLLQVVRETTRALGRHHPLSGS